MKTYPASKEGMQSAAFEIDHVYVSRRTIVRLLKTVKGITDVALRGRFSSSDDIRVEFKYLGRDYVVYEPYGDNRRYWIGPKEDKADGSAAVDIGEIKNTFASYKPPLPIKILGDLASLNFKALFRG